MQGNSYINNYVKENNLLNAKTLGSDKHLSLDCAETNL